MTAYEKRKELRITLPVAEAAAAAVVPSAPTGNLLFSSGHIANRHGKPWAGNLRVRLITEEGKLAARRAAIDLRTTLRHELQDLEKLKRIVKMLCLVNFRAEFYRAAFGRKRRVRASPGSIGRQG